MKATNSRPAFFAERKSFPMRVDFSGFIRRRLISNGNQRGLWMRQVPPAVNRQGLSTLRVQVATA